MSSTIIIVKILYDNHELETLAGRITLAFLVLQDLITIMFLAVAAKSQKSRRQHSRGGVCESFIARSAWHTW